MGQERLLLVADAIDTPDPEVRSARAVLVRGQRIAWVGQDPADAGPHDRRVDLDGAVLQPAYVDAHVHLTVTGLTLGGLDLGGCRSVGDCLAAIHAIADVTPGQVIWGGGWDDLAFPEGRPPTADELASAAPGRPVLLARADGHSSVVDRVSLETAPLARTDGVERDAGGRPTGLLRREANEVAWRWFAAALPESQLAEARDLAVTHALSLGVGCVHEMGGPDLFGVRDFDVWCRGDWPLEVVGYWAAPDLDFVTARGLKQVGGALHLDGTIGSRTAALEKPYADAADCGQLYESTGELAEFVAQATKRRVQVALHCIGDRAVRQALDVLEAAAEAAGREALRACRHRLEHCALVPSALLPRLAALGVVASVQPGFDPRWGQPAGLYERRLGLERADRANPLAPLVNAGVALALGSDGTEAPLDMRAAVTAAVGHHLPAHRLSPDDALRAATVGGRRAARQDDAGRIGVGQRAHLAAFAGDTCVLTMVGGRIVFGG